MPMWQLFVKSLQGNTYTINITDPEPKKMEVAKLRSRVEEKSGIPTKEIKLIYAGKYLLDGKTLEDYPSLQNESTLVLVMRLRGGASQSERLARIDQKLHTSEMCVIGHEEGSSVKMPCGHAINPEMLMEYCWVEVGQRKYEIHCPSCSREWTIDVLVEYGGADKRELGLLEEGLSRNFCEHNQDITQCPGCGYYCTRENKSKFSMQCGICTKSKGKTFRFCFNCHREWKNGYNEHFCGNSQCQTANEEFIRILRTCEEKEVVGVKCPSTRACPNEDCKVLIQHENACKQMTCKICKKQFCFICLRTPLNGSWQCGSYKTKCAPAPRQY